MVDEMESVFEADMRTVLADRVTGTEVNERVMKLMAHMFLRVWTRFAIESGQKLTLTPNQYSLGLYSGQMNWTVNEALNFKNLTRMSLEAKYEKAHALVAETYIHKDEARARLMFALEEEEVKGKPVHVNYLLYDSSQAKFEFEKAAEALRPAMPKWLETVVTRSDGPLWSFCKDNLECVGV